MKERASGKSASMVALAFFLCPTHAQGTQNIEKAEES